MESFFFVPANRLDKLDYINDLNLDNIIIDFEDSVVPEQRKKSFTSLLRFNNYNLFWLRIPLREDFESDLQTEFLIKAHRVGIRKIVLPKIIDSRELVKILELFEDVTYLILVEHPKLLIELTNFLVQNENYKRQIYAVGLGSHDLLAFMNVKHDLPQLEYPRKKLQYIAKAYDLKTVDIASMNIVDKEAFQNEISYAINNGFDGKFLIHPRQWEWMKSTLVKRNEDLTWAKKIVSHLPKEYVENSKNMDINPFVIDGEVIEKPHVLRAIKILKNRVK